VSSGEVVDVCGPYCECLVSSAYPCSCCLQLTAKRLQCIRSLVNLAQCYAEDLGRGWWILLRTLHHLTHVLGLQPQANGALRPVRRTLDASSMVGLVAGGSRHETRTKTSTVLPAINCFESFLQEHLEEE